MSLISYDQALKNLTHQLLATEQVESVPLCFFPSSAFIRDTAMTIREGLGCMTQKV